MLFVASANPDKAREMVEIMRSAGMDACIPPEGALPGTEETGSTIMENALLKARAACASLHAPCIADDTGLFVRALGGAPGVYTSRFAGPGCSYEENVRKLIRVIMWEKGDSRRATFETAAVLCTPSGEEIRATGELEGVILDEPRGSGGFGYDPVFLLPHLGITLAECDREQKNALSHRNRALRALSEAIASRQGILS